MPLATHVQNRVPNQVLVELTNHNDRSATTVNTATLGFAVNDTIADLEILAGLEYDDTDAKHIAVAVQGVIHYLNTYRALEIEEIRQRQTRWEEMCRNLAKVTSRNRITPKSNSVLTPSAERNDTETVRPDFDREYFEDYNPGPPGYGPRIGRPGEEDL